MHPVSNARTMFRWHAAESGVALAGEIDRSVQTLFRKALRRTDLAQGEPVDIDVAGLDFVDHHAIVELDELGRQHQARIVLRNPGYLVARIVQLMNLDFVGVGGVSVRSGAASGTKGYFHEAALYGSDDEFLAIVLPFLADGVAAGEPTLVTLGEANSQLVRSALTKTRGISFLSGGDAICPAGRLDPRVPGVDGRAHAQGCHSDPHRRGRPASRCRCGVGGWWARYEAAVNDAYNAYPRVGGLCPYDVRHTPAEVLADVTRTHPHLATVDGGHVINPDFVDPTGFLAGLINNPPPPEPEPPSITLTNPTADAARSAVRRIAEQSLTALGDSTVSDMIFAVSEGVDNAMVYGTAPTTLRIWNYRDRLVAHVTDAGAGPTDPYAGLLRASDTTGAGLGLWLAHQMCADVTLHRHRGGFTLRIATTNN